ncbi:MAG: thiamine pyrophosphate-binding protein [Candidatus Lokiarchaeota archaeon]|nr:thiamine pyrophosphate-binding protein [Candidatus Lokiarchaeota archaeon]MBD3198908.1 thiamine pyrophosphate-binding protein [Candidatus Lokiarchaeota archaeon]
MNGGEIIANVLKKNQVQYLFTLCGGHIAPILVGAKKQGIRVIDVRHEPTAVFAADAISRLTGIPGVAVVTAGPGVTNSITAIKNAQMAQSPLILLGGAAATALQGRGALQDIEQLKLYESIVKWRTKIEQNCDIVETINEAFDVAKSGVPGPVFIECPIDLLYDEELVKEWYGKRSGSTSSIKGKVVNWYLRRHADKLFACSLDEIINDNNEKIIPFSVDQKELEEVASQINNSKKPLLVLGGQTTKRVEIINDLQSGLKELGIPTFLASMARGLFRKDHPSYFRHGRSKALREADVVIIAGMPCDFRLNYGRSINKNGYFIAINRSEEDLKKNRKPNIAIQADPGTFLVELSKSFEFNPVKWNNWFETLRKNEEIGKQKIERFANSETDYINPLNLLKVINTKIEDNGIIIGDGGDFVATTSYIVKPRNALSWLDPGPFGTLGVGAGFALAAKLVNPDSEIWLFWGDGACGYSIAEFDTFVRHNLPIIAIVGNDAGWTQIERDQVEYLKDDVGTQLNYTNYHVVAKGYGAEGFIVKSEKNIEKIINQAKRISLNGTPVLINALIGKTDYRKGSISM